MVDGAQEKEMSRQTDKKNRHPGVSKAWLCQVSEESTH